MTTAHAYAREHAGDFKEQLKDLIRLPSVSTDPAYAPQVRRTAEWLVAHFTGLGLAARLIEKEGRHPIVFAEWNGAGAAARTVLIYGHYDVQPAQKADGWLTEPFEPVEQNGRIYARGATDDKGQMFIHVKAVEAILKTRGRLPVNVKFLIEGEEESGGEHIAQYVNSHPPELRADVCLISDGGMTRIEEPVIVNALRGATGLEITVYGPKADLHSGMYGGSVYNPLQALAEIIARLHDDAGRVTVPGFYDDVLPLTAEERAEIAATELDEATWRAETGASLPWGEAGYSLSERLGARPTLEITGLAGGYHERGFKNIVPAKALAKISIRLVANQQPAKILALVEDYLRQLTPPAVRLEITARAGGMGAALVNTATPMMQAAINAYRQGWGAAPVFKREGGSIPIVSSFQSVLGLPVILMGFGLNSDGLHGPNESYSIEMFERGIATAIHFLDEVAAL
ncbi:MAG: dipeptidase [Anaerolineae bacterium]|nr:dipeptidase [Anaerolineae bacterium]